MVYKKENNTLIAFTDLGTNSRTSMLYYYRPFNSIVSEKIVGELTNRRIRVTEACVVVQLEGRLLSDYFSLPPGN